MKVYPESKCFAIVFTAVATIRYTIYFEVQPKYVCDHISFVNRNEIQSLVSFISYC